MRSMAYQDDKKNIHFNPDFITKRVDAQTLSRVHVNPAFFQKSASSQVVLQPTNYYSSSTINNSIQNSSDVWQPSVIPVIAQTQPSKVCTPYSLVKQNKYTFEHANNNGPRAVVSSTNSKQTSMISQPRPCNTVNTSLSVYPTKGTLHCQPQESHTSISTSKPSVYSWIKSKSGKSDYSLSATFTSRAPRSTKRLDTAKSFSSSRFKYQCKDVSDDKSLKSWNHTSSKSRGSKFIVDNRKSVQGLQGNPNLTKCVYQKQCDVKRDKHSKIGAPSNNLGNQEMVDGSKFSVVETSKMRNEKNGSTVFCKQESITPLTIGLCSASTKISKRSDTVKHASNSIPTAPVNGLNSFAYVHRSLPLSVESKSVVMNSKPVAVTASSHSTLDVRKPDVMHSAKNIHCQNMKNSGSSTKNNSNILINPVFLKSLSSNNNVDILAIASKSHSQKNASSVVQENSKLATEKSNYTMNRVAKESPYTTSKYKVISRTKLVRRRSRSFSKVKTKVNFVKERVSEGKFMAHPYSKKREGSSVTLCRFSSKFPTRSLNSWNKIHPKRRYAVISRTKLIRRLSSSSSTCDDVFEKPKYSVKTKTKLVKRLSGSSPKYPRTLERLKFSRIKSDAERKKNYAVLSSTKLIRRRSNSGVFKSKGQREASKSNGETIIRRHKLVRNARVKSGNVATFKDSGNQVFRRINTKYKIENRSLGLSAKQKAAKGIVSKYRINRLKSDSPVIKKTSSRRFIWISSKRKLHYSQAVRKRSSERFSDRIINIGGILYKATQTSLRKQLAKKRRSHDEVEGSKCIVKLHGNQYHLSAGGRTLTRIMNKPASLSGPSLSRVHIGGLTYSRTKTGQYELTKFHQARAVVSSAKQRSMVMLSQRRKRGTLQKCNQQCIFFKRFGRCTKKDKGECPYLHNPKRVAVCTRFLRGRCPVNNCPFSHEVDPDKMPVCSHFVRSICTRDDCPYRHVRVNPNAALCLDFLHGHCALGQECKKQHVLVCEEFSMSGKCPRGESCPLSHWKGSRKKIHVSLEPSLGSASNKIHGCQPRKRKSSDTLDVLGGPQMRKKEKKLNFKTRHTVHKRYFQVSGEDDDTVKGNSGVDDDSVKINYKVDAASTKESNVGSSSKEFISEDERNPVVSYPSITGTSCGSKEEQKTPKNEMLKEQNTTIKSPLGTCNVEQKRERVLQKVEKLKESYLLVDTAKTKSSIRNKEENQIHDGCRVISKSEMELKSSSDKEIATTKSENCKFQTYERRPLPKRLPSYISLHRENDDDVEDL